MANLSSLLRNEMTRLAKKATKEQFAELQMRSASQRRDIAALKREVTSLRRSIASGSKQGNTTPAAAPQDDQKLRFQARGLITDRKRLGVSAGDYGRLVGVSGQTIYHWEQGKSSPRRAQLVALAAIRGIGKREAIKRLDDSTE